MPIGPSLNRIPRRRPSLLLLVGALLSFLPAVAVAQDTLAETSPRLALPPSRLQEPFDAPILVGLFLSAGAGNGEGQEPLEPGYGGVIVMRPGSVNFLEFLYRWNLGLVLQVDYQRLSATDDVLSGDGILRYYFGDRGRDRTAVHFFIGAGIGATNFTVPGTEGEIHDSYFSGLLEIGQDWLVADKWYFGLKGQYRVHLRPHHHYGAWAVQLIVGVPWPF